MTVSAVCALAAAVGITGCAGSPQQAAVGAASLDAYASVAKRIYASERDGPPVRASLRRIARDAAVVRGNRAALLHQLFLPGYHVVRLRVVRHGRVAGDVGGRFVVAGPTRGDLTISIQDVIGYVKLVHRLTGQGVVVRGRAGHVAASSPTLRKLSLPTSGTIAIGATSASVTSFDEPGFGGETLHVWLVG